MRRENMIKYVCIFSGEISRLINYILLTSFYCRKVTANRLVHLDVEVRSEELLAPALLCHKEPARPMRVDQTDGERPGTKRDISI